MRGIKYSVSLLFLFLLIFCSFQVCFTQIIDNFVIVNPCQVQYPTPGRTMGGATAALADSAPIVFNNPSSLSQLRRIKLLLSMNVGRGYFGNTSLLERGIKPHHWNDGLSIGTVAVSLPFQLLNCSFTVASSYNSTLPYDYVLREDYFSIQHQYSGQLQTISSGLGTQCSSTFRIGVGWTHWFGKSKWKGTNYPWSNGEVTHKTAHYDGDLFYIGMQKEFSPKISFGLTFYFPYQLTISNKETLTTVHEYEYKSEQHQKFKGAFRAGFAYKMSSSFKFGLGYEYQNRLTTQLQLYSSDSQVNYSTITYSSISSFAVGFEYNFHIDKIVLPLYIMYKATLLPETSFENSLFPDIRYQMPSPQFDKNAISHLFEIGSNIRLRYFTMYLTAQWKQSGRYIKYLPGVVPYIPMSSFDVRKLTFSFGILTQI